MASNPESLVYDSDDICRIYDCHKNHIPALIKNGVIPAPINEKNRSRKKWLKTQVHKKLGIHAGEKTLGINEIRQLIRHEVERAISGALNQGLAKD